MNSKIQHNFTKRKNFFFFFGLNPGFNSVVRVFQLFGV